MTSLKVMYLFSNKNSCLQKQFFSGQTNLLKLSVIDNGLTDVDVGAFENLDKLDGLYLFHNKIKRFEINGKSLKLLTTLELSRNSLEEISNLFFQGLFNLNQLVLNRNAITHIEAGSNLFEGLILNSLKMRINRFIDTEYINQRGVKVVSNSPIYKCYPHTA